MRVEASYPVHSWRPHHVDPIPETVRLVQAVKNFASYRGVCHIGLGVTATNNMKVLRANGINCESWAAQTSKELWKLLADDEGKCEKTGQVPVSHVVVSAPSWVQPESFKNMCLRWPHIEFVQLNHSGCAFLSIDKYGIRNIRQCIDLSLELHNLRVGSNNTRVYRWLANTFNFKPVLLSNLYDVTSFVNPYQRQKPIGNLIRIGSFGASRPWKNQLTAAEAAVQLARQLGVGLELYVNAKRPDGGERMIESRAELFDGMRDCTIVEVPWETWPIFRRTVSYMHLLFSPSFDETFNVVTADGIAEGVASVVAPSIEWCPPSWQSEPCDPDTIVKVATHLLHDHTAVDFARDLLSSYVDAGLLRWQKYLLHKD